MQLQTNDLYPTNFVWNDKPFLDRLVDGFNTPVRCALNGRTITWVNNQANPVYREERPSTLERIAGIIITLIALPFFLAFQFIAYPYKKRSYNQHLLSDCNQAVKRLNDQAFSAAENGDVETLKQLAKRGWSPLLLSKDDSARIVSFADQNGPLAVYLLNCGAEAIGKVTKDDLNAIRGWAVRNKNLDALEWAHEKGLQLNDDICSRMPNWFEGLKWAYNKGCAEAGAYMCTAAASEGNLEGLQWARAKGCRMEYRTCPYAAKGGHLEYCNGLVPMAARGMQGRALLRPSGGHLEVLQWARANGCPWDESTCVRGCPQEATLRYCNGLVPTAAHGMNDTCYWAAEEATLSIAMGSCQRLPME